MDRRPKDTFIQRKHKGDQEAHGKMLSITNYQRNTNQNYNEISLHIRQNGQHHKVHKQKMLERAWRKGTLLHYWWECQLVQPLWRTVGSFLKKLNIGLP